MIFKYILGAIYRKQYINVVFTQNNSMVKKLVITVKRIAEIMREKRLATVAGAWVYYFLLSIVPLFFLLITAFGVFGLSFTEELSGRLPEEFAPAISLISAAAENISGGITVFFLFTVIFSCTSLLSRMSADGDHIYGQRNPRGLWRRLWAILALAVLFGVFLGTALLFAFGNKVVAGGSKTRYAIFTFFVFGTVIMVAYLIIILLNKFISPVKISFATAATGGFISLVTIVTGTIGFTLYIRFFNSYNAFYGSLAAVVIFLLWTYILMWGLALGAIVNSCITESKLKAQKHFFPQNVRLKPPLVKTKNT